MARMRYPFVSESNGFRIEITTDFDFEQSNPMQFHYLFRYNISIKNIGNVSAQLVSRKWNIKNGRGEMQFVEGPGVVGQTPHFRPGESYDYSSFCPFPTMVGEMWGHFNMIDSSGKKFKIDTPVFRFEVPKDYIDDY
jgi:ApaG protein